MIREIIKAKIGRFLKRLWERSGRFAVFKGSILPRKIVDQTGGCCGIFNVLVRIFLFAKRWSSINKVQIEFSEKAFDRLICERHFE